VYHSLKEILLHEESGTSAKDKQTYIKHFVYVTKKICPKFELKTFHFGKFREQEILTLKEGEIVGVHDLNFSFTHGYLKAKIIKLDRTKTRATLKSLTVQIIDTNSKVNGQKFVVSINDLKKNRLLNLCPTVKFHHFEKSSSSSTNTET